MVHRILLPRRGTKPGERQRTGGSPTPYQFTGQFNQISIGLYWYQSRYYDSSLGRFTSPDTVIPEASQGVQAWDRYAYANNNPVKYNDPSGHCIGPLAVVCVIVGLAFLAGMIPGDSRVYEPPQGSDPILQTLIALTLITAGGSTPALGTYLSSETAEEVTSQPYQLAGGNLAHPDLETAELANTPIEQRPYVDIEKYIFDPNTGKSYVDPITGKTLRPDFVNHLTGEVIDWKSSTHTSGYNLQQAINQAQNYVNVFNRIYGDTRKMEGLPEYKFVLKFYEAKYYYIY